MGDPASAKDSHWPQPNTTLGGYRLVQVLGSGGMGRVYLAERKLQDLERRTQEVALKVLDPDLAKRKTVRDFFLQEAELGKGLSHPNLVGFLESGEHDGFLFLAFEYIHGVSLDKLIKKSRDDKKPLAQDLVISVLQDVAFGLAAAHQRGIVHRDLKPQNVMITPDDMIKVIDFGLADADAGIGEGKTVGTPVYAAPEQNLGRRTDASADVYALGLFAYEMFSGSRLLPGGGIQKVLQQQIKLQKVLEQGVSLNPRIPKELTPILRRMLEFKPADRYPSAVDVAAVLERSFPVEKGARSDVLARTKAHALAELADTHYWKALELARSGRTLEAAGETGRLVSLRPPTLRRLRQMLSTEIADAAWDPGTGGPAGEVRSAPEPDLESLEELASWAKAADLPALRTALEGRLARLARYYQPPFLLELGHSRFDSVPILQELLATPDLPRAERARIFAPLAWAYLALNLPERARVTAEQGLREDPGNPGIQVALSQIAGRLEELEAAKEALVAMIRVIGSQGDPEEKVERARQFAEKYPGLGQAWQLLLDEAKRAGDLETAREALLRLGQKELILREPGYGFRHFRGALQLFPSRSDLQLLLVESLRAGGRLISLPPKKEERARRVWALANLPDPRIAELEEQLGAPSANGEAIEDLIAQVAETGDRARLSATLLKAATSHAARGAIEEAKAAFEDMLAVAPDRTSAVAALRAAPLLDKVFNRMQLARLLSDA